MNELNKEIIKRLFLGEVIMDDHDPRGIAKWVSSRDFVTYERGGEEWICPVVSGSYVSLNPLVLDEDGVIHLCTASVGGVVNSMSSSLQDAILAYSDSVGGKITGFHTL